ncbi:MAG TPA: AsmA family protein [Alphaproteobacteria bacterium]|nr:AsmA family protein [Alphaproteobacteria bacterium]
MLRLVKWLAIVVVGLIVVVVAAALIVPNVINWNAYKPQIAQAVKDATGRDLRIDGDVKISMWPDLDFSIAGIHFANAPGATPQDMVSVGSTTGRIAIWPLLRRELDVVSLIVQNASVHLAVDKDGNPNWVFAPAKAAPAQPAPAPAVAEANEPGYTVRLGELKLEGSEVSYIDATTGQNIDAKDINVTTAMSDPAKPFSVNAQMTLNAEPVKIELALDSPQRLLDGQKAKAKLNVASKWLTANYDGSAQQQPTPGLDGAFDLAIVSVGQLANWLGRPLEKSQPDPGPLKLHADFASDGAKTVLKDATLQGTALNAKASGSFDASGAVKKLAVDLESGELDVDRYLPPPAPKTAAQTAAPRPAAAQPAAATSKDPFAALSDKPLDLSALKGIDADIKVAIAGVKAMGYEIGRTALAVTAKGGVMNADLSELALYGGSVKGHVKLDGSGKALDADTSFKIDHVTIDKLAAAASTAAAGAVSATLDAAAQGASPRALAENLHGKLALDLSGVSVKSANAHGISGAKLDLDMPAADKPLTIKADLVYNGEHVNLDASSDPLRKVLSADKFAAKLALASNPIKVSYDGAVQQRPVAGLDGSFDLDVPSVGKLASWLGEPLDPKQPDPGPLKAHAVLAANGSKISVNEATITGKALKATAQASFDGSQKIANLDAKIDVQQADLNAYLPPENKSAAPQPKGAAPAAPGAAPSAQQPSGWSTEPLDLSALHNANGQVLVQLAGIGYRDLSISQGQIKSTLKDGVLKLTVEKLALAQGTITSDATLDGSGPAAKLDYQATVNNVQALPLLKTFADTSRLSGTMNFQTNGKASGKSEKELVETLNGAGQFKITDGAIHGINLAATLRQAGTLGLSNSANEKTDFAELSGTFTIKDGVVDNRDMQMLAPVIRLTGAGTVPMPPQTVDYAVEAKLVGTLQGQGGAQSLDGLPIPIKITGSWNNPNYQVDWKSVFTEMAKDPSRMKNLPANLQGAAKGFGVNVPGAAAGGATGGILNSIPGLAPPPSSTGGSTAQPSGQPAQPSGQQPSNSPVQNVIKGLFGN